MNSPVTIDPRKGKTSASNAAADELCPGRHLAQAGLPDEGPRSSKDAEAGRNLHTALHKRDPASLTVPLKETYDACVALEDRLVFQFFGSNASKCKVIREQRFWAKFRDSAGTEYEHSGQPDVIYRYGDRALILEYKALYGDLDEAASNLQLRDQACLFKGNSVAVNEIGVAKIQPMKDPDPSICAYNEATLKESEQRMFERVKRSNTPGAPRCAGELQCKFCRAKHVCVPHQQWAGGMVPGMLTLLDVSPMEWTPQQRAAFLDKSKVAQQWLDDCHDVIFQMMEKDPECVPGYFLKPGARKITITNPQLCFERFAKLGGTIDQFMTCISVGREKIKTAVNALTGAKGKTLDSAMAVLCEGITVESQNKPSIKKAAE